MWPTIHGFHVTRDLGAGTYSYVYAVRRRGTAEPLAAKVLKPHLLNDYEAVENFKTECERLLGVEHPNLVRVYGTEKVTVPGYPSGIALLMECHDRSLAEWCAIHRSTFERVTMCRQVSDLALALDYLADERQLVHRDVKPTNIFLAGPEERPRCVLGDLGLARRLGTRTIGAGTDLYLAPELRSGTDTIANRQSDVYSLGVVATQALSGGLPPAEQRQRTGVWARGIGQGLAATLETAMSADLVVRFPTAGAFRQALENQMTTPDHVPFLVHVARLGPIQKRINMLTDWAIQNRVVDHP